VNPTVIAALGIVALAVLGAIVIVLMAVRRGYTIAVRPVPPVSAQAKAAAVAAVPERRAS
jgi:hypothetical protein